MTNIRGRDEETTPARSTSFTSVLVFWSQIGEERREEINDLKFITKKTFSNEFAAKLKEENIL